MDDRSVAQDRAASEGAAADVELTESEHAQVERLAAELAGLMDLPEDPRITQAAYELLHLFVVEGGMSVSRAIDTLGSSLRLTLAKMADTNRRH